MRRTRCQQCGGGSLCAHGKRKDKCSACAALHRTFKATPSSVGKVRNGSADDKVQLVQPLTWQPVQPLVWQRMQQSAALFDELEAMGADVGGLSP